MRTTLTLDDDVARQVEKIRRDRELPLKEVVNQALRAGLRALEEPAATRVEFRTEPLAIGECLLPDLDDVSGALAIAEGEGYG